MAHTPHELAEEFPQQVALMQSLREIDAHFVNLADEYHTINRAIHRAETNVEATSDDHMTEMRKRRLHLKDMISVILNEASG